MITLNDISRLTNIRENGIEVLVASGALSAVRSGKEVALTMSALYRLQDMRIRCIKEMARAFGLPAEKMFSSVKSEHYIFDVEDSRVILDPESEGHLVQELLKAKKGGIGI